MPTSIWHGSISFGLVTIPVSLLPAVAAKDLSFHLLDSRNLSPLRIKRVNEAGEEVAWEHVVKGRRLPDGRWVTLTEEEFHAANVKATQTIDVLGAVCADEVPLRYFSTPYHLVPDKPGIKAYALLREALRNAGRIALARIVLRTRQHLCALVPEGDLLVLELMRYQAELRPFESLDVPGSSLEALGVTPAEVVLAEQLVAAIETPWEPERYRDTYRDDVLALIERKAEGTALPPPQRRASSSTSTTHRICTGTFASSLTACRCHGLCRRAPRPTQRTSGSPRARGSPSRLRRFRGGHPEGMAQAG